MDLLINQSLSLAPWILGLIIFMTGRWTLRFIARRSVYIYGHRIPKNGEDVTNGTTVYRLAIQNADSTPVEVPMIARISIPGDHGEIRRYPKVHAGPRKLRGRRIEKGRAFEIEFDRFPAYDTWVIECSVREPVEGVQFELFERKGERERVVKSVRDSRILVTPGVPLAQAGRMRAPALPLTTGAWLVGMTTYALVLTILMRYYEYQYSWRQVLEADLPIALAVFALAFMGIVLVRRHGPSPIQGYLCSTKGVFPRRRKAGGSAPIEA